MRLVEQHIIKSNHKHYNDLKNLCRLSKNLYNATLYAIRQHYFDTNKYLSYANIDRIFKETNNRDYRSLPIQTSQQTMRAVDSNFRSFFKLLKMKQNGKYNKKVNITRYLDKEGYYTVTYTAQQLGKKLQSGIIKLPLSDIEFHTNKTNIKQVRFVPKGSYIVMEVVYDAKEADLKSDNGLSLLANSITLTPGTITLDVYEEDEKDYLYIHWINVETEDEEKAGVIIKGKFEKWIRGIFK